MAPGNGGGNPNHDPEDGRFTSGPGGGGGKGDFWARWNETGEDPLRASSHGPIDAHTTVTKTVLQQLKDVGVKVTKAPKDSEGFLRWHLEVEGPESTDKYILTSEAGHIKHVLAYKGGHALRDPSAHQVWTFLDVQNMF